MPAASTTTRRTSGRASSIARTWARNDDAVAKNNGPAYRTTGPRDATGGRVAVEVGEDRGVRQSSELVDPRLCRAAEDVDRRQQRGDGDAVQRAVEDHPEGRHDRDGALDACGAPDPRDAADVDEPERRRQDHGPERRDRQVREEAREEDEHERHGTRRR